MASQNFLSATQNYPELMGIRTNLYKCFLPQVWHFGNPSYIAGLLHPEGIYDDARGGHLRSLVYPRLRAHYQFQNEKLLFPIGNRSIFMAQLKNNSILPILRIFLRLKPLRLVINTMVKEKF